MAKSIQKSGVIGIIIVVVGLVLLLYTFLQALELFSFYIVQPISGGEITATIELLIGAAVRVMFLGIMGWIGSILLMRGVDFLKVDRGVGIVTFKVDKGVGIVTNVEEEDKGKEEAKA